MDGPHGVSGHEQTNDDGGFPEMVINPRTSVGMRVTDGLTAQDDLIDWGYNLDLVDFGPSFDSLPPILKQASAASTRYQTANEPALPRSSKHTSEASSLTPRMGDLNDWLDYCWDDWPNVDLGNGQEGVGWDEPSLAAPSSSANAWAELAFHYDTPDSSPPSLSLSGYPSHTGSEPSDDISRLLDQSPYQDGNSAAFSKLYSIPEKLEAFSQPALDYRSSISPVLDAGILKTAVTKKRPSNMMQESDSECSEPQQPQLRRRLDHSKIEQRYRTKLKDKIRELGECVPSLQSGLGRTNPDDTDKMSAPNPSKGVILTKAKDYICELEQKVQRLDEEALVMKKQVRLLRHAATAGLSQTGNHDAGRGRELKKLLLACLAGILTTEAAHTTEQGSGMPNGRGLFALPMQFVETIVRSLYRLRLVKHASSFEVLVAFTKLILFAAATVYLVWSLLSATNQKRLFVTRRRTDNHKGRCSVAGPQALRRLGFETAIQTVWVSSGIAGQLAAFTLGLGKLVLMHIGIDMVAVGRLTRSSQETEAARIKAWDVLLDSQLAGGDGEVNKMRLMLTLVAAASLPESPYRRMMIALHIQILACATIEALPRGKQHIRDVANLFSRRQWDRARVLQEQHSQDDLPEHLKHLLSLDQEEVFTDETMPLLCDLVWQTSRTYSSAGLSCSVGGDPSVRSPLDCLAALWTHISIRQTLISYLDGGVVGSKSQADIMQKLQFIIDTAPPGSVALGLALVARAVMIDQDQPKHIRIALHAANTLPINLGLEERLQREATDDTGASSEAHETFHVEFALPLQCAIATALFHHQDCKKAMRGLAKNLTRPMTDLGLLGFLSLYRFLEKAFKNQTVAVENTELLEQMAGLIRPLLDFVCVYLGGWLG
ncbi:hypothetical protein MGU_07104 [Metarhizium guizhouense ARSEF 977]|uniref:BHLH domain-containing protein n=1 Tax=Metarhizium guizhouense (strain ARSEF 977) TaxID=1276136 RepID=A0A0B4H7P5_METGA|nr:hypothetical protein MGU_07104 [Metarhizium guizhouense ARSEF 977]